jgi:hypothetical protein
MPRGKPTPNAKKPTKVLKRLLLRHLAAIYSHAQEIPDANAISDYETGEMEDLAMSLSDVAYDAQEAQSILEILVAREDGVA